VNFESYSTTLNTKREVDHHLIQSLEVIYELISDVINGTDKQTHITCEKNCGAHNGLEITIRTCFKSITDELVIVVPKITKEIDATYVTEIIEGKLATFEKKIPSSEIIEELHVLHQEIQKLTEKLDQSEIEHQLQIQKLTDELHQLDTKRREQFDVVALHQLLRSGDLDKVAQLVDQGCMYTSETFLLLLIHGSYPLYQKWCAKGLTFDCFELLHTDLDIDANIFHDFEWFDDVASVLQKYLKPPHHSPYPFFLLFIMECLGHCGDPMFIKVIDKYGVLLNDYRGIMCIHGEFFTEICSSQLKFNYIKKKRVDVTRSPFDGNHGIVDDLDICRKLIGSKVRFAIKSEHAKTLGLTAQCPWQAVTPIGAYTVKTFYVAYHTPSE
jgi:hypothetical protein